MKVAKKLFFDLDGIGRVDAKPGGNFNPGGNNRTAVMTDLGVAGYDEEPVAPTMSFVLPNNGKVSLAEIRNLTDVNVTVQDDNGVVWVVSGCFVTEPPGLNNGEMSVSMSGVRADPVS